MASDQARGDPALARHPSRGHVGRPASGRCGSRWPCSASPPPAGRRGGDVRLGGAARRHAAQRRRRADRGPARRRVLARPAGRRPAGTPTATGGPRTSPASSIVVVIAGSAVARRVGGGPPAAGPAPTSTTCRAVAAAGVIGFVGNEVVAGYRIRVGRRIGSAALVADGLHARTDGFTSLGGAGRRRRAWRSAGSWADPVVGLAITRRRSSLVLRDAAREVYRRLMDAVDPAPGRPGRDGRCAHIPGVRDVGEVRMRWIGHRLRAEADDRGRRRRSPWSTPTGSPPTPSTG